MRSFDRVIGRDRLPADEKDLPYIDAIIKAVTCTDFGYVGVLYPI